MSDIDEPSKMDDPRGQELRDAYITAYWTLKEKIKEYSEYMSAHGKVAQFISNSDDEDFPPIQPPAQEEETSLVADMSTLLIAPDTVTKSPPKSPPKYSSDDDDKQPTRVVLSRKKIKRKTATGTYTYHWKIIYDEYDEDGKQVIEYEDIPTTKSKK